MSNRKGKGPMIMLADTGVWGQLLREESGSSTPPRVEAAPKASGHFLGGWWGSRE